ncbi:MAG: cold shock domain-containing protein [Leptospira sp.]|jgi:cold shock CspA family protein|nr:cold shock domain-containing protein [Leptospira sp.]
MSKTLVSGWVKKFIPQDQDTKRGGFGFIVSDNKEYFFNIKNCNIPSEHIKQGLEVKFKPIIGIDKVKNIPADQAVNVEFA